MGMCSSKRYKRGLEVKKTDLTESQKGDAAKSVQPMVEEMHTNEKSTLNAVKNHND